MKVLARATAHRPVAPGGYKGFTHRPQARLYSTVTVILGELATASEVRAAAQ